MKSKSTSNLQKNFLFGVCMNQSGIHANNQLQQHKPNLNNLKKINSSKTLSKPVSMQDLHLNRKGKFIKKPEQFQPFRQTLPRLNLQPNNVTSSLAHSAHIPQNPGQHSNNLVQSQHSRRSGKKIKIFSNDNSKGSIKIQDERGKSISRDSNGNSSSREKRGIHLTKTLLKRISGMYSTQDFGKNSQPTSHRTSHYQKHHALKHQQDSFHNQTAFLMTTWDSQRTTQEYQLTRQYDSLNNQTRNDNFSLATYGTMNVLNNSYESIRTKDFPKHSFHYSNNEIAEYQMREGLRKSIEANGKAQKNFGLNGSPKKLQNPMLIKQNSAPLPPEYQQNQTKRESYHLTIKPEGSRKDDQMTSISKGKMVIKESRSKVLSSKSKIPSNQSSNVSSNSMVPVKKHSLTFSKSKQLPKLATNILSKSPLFETAHQILSQEVSSIKQPFYSSQSNKQISGQELTNFLYGNRGTNTTKMSSTMDSGQKQKYLVRYKNKTLEDMSLKQSMVDGYDHYYQ